MHAQEAFFSLDEIRQLIYRQRRCIRRDDGTVGRVFIARCQHLAFDLDALGHGFKDEVGASDSGSDVLSHLHPSRPLHGRIWQQTGSDVTLYARKKSVKRLPR